MSVSSKVAKKRVSIDLNLLPDEYQRRFRLRPGHVLFVLVGLGLIFNLLLFQARAQVNERTSLLESQLRTTQTENRKLSEQQNQAGELKSGIEKNKGLLAQKKGDYDFFVGRKLSWTVLTNTITDPPGITLGSLSQRGNGITLKGSAPAIALIQDYINYLNASDLFSDISLFTELKSRNEISFIINLKVKINEKAN